MFCNSPQNNCFGVVFLARPSVALWAVRRNRPDRAGDDVNPIRITPSAIEKKEALSRSCHQDIDKIDSYLLREDFLLIKAFVHVEVLRRPSSIDQNFDTF